MQNTSTSQESNKKEEQVSLTKASEVLMPDENVLGEPDDISSAIVKKISDDVEDARTLREYRVISAVVLGGTAALFLRTLDCLYCTACLVPGSSIFSFAVSNSMYCCASHFVGRSYLVNSLCS